MKPLIRQKFYLSPAQTLTIGFILIIFIGTYLLKLPFALKPGVTDFSWIDALFTATSAICITGLVVHDTLTTFSIFGQIVIITMVQLGGIGFMTVATMVAMMMRKRISLRNRLVLQEAMNSYSMQGIVRLIRKVILYSVLIEITAALIFTLLWMDQFSLAKAFYMGLFHAISLFNNGGFDLFGSFSSFQSLVNDPIFNIVSIVIVLAGGLGFVVLAELLEYKKTRRLSLQSKVVLSATTILWIAGSMIIFVLEYTNSNTLGSLDLFGKIYASMFQSISARSAGTSTLDIAALRQATQFILILFMFIGAAPGSTGGGIKITTFAILIVSSLALLRGREDVEMFRFRLPKDLILKALTITFIALFVVISVSTVLSTTESASFISILFETTSAVGTVGYSMGLTPHLTDFGKLVLSLAMLYGRLGPLTLAFALGARTTKRGFRHPEGRMMIG